MKKKRKRTDEDDYAENVDPGSGGNVVMPGYEVQGIVTKKYLFDQYPKSIMK
eukprot:CAMPEP_0202470822 /NCGR_PEP_ID=MMETSP1360-20130828/82717_1 /ASSEMBLY_ACC=CAM_ASM_000848 /TAXON_ID=515479 /ORGANISM="Licmophora paradoxa, Strain CCMP2313" /LENGTH=51 /DNA_ID=CAMNT_0049096661 /DNA_START=36 /DNA_END=191 /DNA_ORIENTATION=-